MRVLVTGCNGLLGREVVSQLAAAGHQPTGCDLREPAAGTGVQADVTLMAEVVGAMAQASPEAVIHTAGLVGPVARRRAYAAVHVNVLGTLNVLEAARLHGCRRIVLCSSAQVYGRSALGSADARQSEDDPLDPFNPYGASKAAAEMLQRGYANAFGLHVFALRFTRLYGPLLAMTEGAAMRELGPILEAVLSGRPVTVPIERPGPRGEYVYVKDAARAAVLAIEAPAGAAGPYNVAGGLPVDRDAVLDAICDAVPEARHLIHRDYRPPAGGEPARQVPLATERAEAALGYRARFGLAEGMRDLVAALRG